MRAAFFQADRSLPLLCSGYPLNSTDSLRGYLPAPLMSEPLQQVGSDFYVSIIKNSKIGSVSRYGEEAAAASGRPNGSVMALTFRLDGQEFMALNGGRNSPSPRPYRFW
jgi:hypothetical protein